MNVSLALFEICVTMTTIIESQNCHGTLAKLLLGKRTVAFLSYACHDDELHVYTVTTLKRFQRMGFASQLLKYVIESHSDKNYVAKVLQGHENTECMNLFTKFGFHIENKADGIYMVKYVH